MTETLGGFLRSARERMRKAQHEIASELGVTTSLISGIEQGKNRVTLERLVGFAKAYEVDVTDIVKRLPEDQRELVYEVARSTRLEEEETTGAWYRRLAGLLQETGDEASWRDLRQAFRLLRAVTDVMDEEEKR